MKIKTTIISVTIISTYVHFAIFLDLYQLPVSFPMFWVFIVIYAKQKLN